MYYYDDKGSDEIFSPISILILFSLERKNLSPFSLLLQRIACCSILFIYLTRV